MVALRPMLVVFDEDIQKGLGSMGEEEGHREISRGSNL